jgi:hypothetical protein
MTANVIWQTTRKGQVLKPFQHRQAKTVSHLHEVEVRLCYSVIIIRSVYDRSYGSTIHTMLLQPNIRILIADLS